MMEDHDEGELEAVRAELDHSKADDTLLNNSKVNSNGSNFSITENIRPSSVSSRVMRRNLNDPDSNNAGERKPQKPRLGVKVPYPYLTSIIVTPHEIAQELADRFSRKDYTDPKVRDPYLAKKLTQRLANKINQNKGVKDSAEENLLEKNNSPIVDKKIDQESADLIKKTVFADLKKETLSETAREIFTEISNSLVGGVISEDPILNDSFKSRLRGRKTGKAVENGVSKKKATEVTEIDDESSVLEPKKKIKTNSGVKGKRIKVNIDPKLEREIALKQLESIPTIRKTKINENDNLLETRSSSNSGNNNSGGTVNNNTLNSSKNKKVKQNPNKLYENSSFVKKFPKKYQQKKLQKKRKSLLNSSMKLPDVPEVQIAIDNYIKAYAKKRKLKSSPIVDNDDMKKPSKPLFSGFKKQPPTSTPVQKVRKVIAAEASRIICRHSSDSEYPSDEENYLDDSNSVINKAVEKNSVRLTENRLDVEKVAASNKKSNLGENGIELSKHAKERSPDGLAVLIHKNVTQIILSPSSDRMKNYLTIEILNKFTDTLKKLEEWVDCNVVLVTANGKSFCDGIDIKKLICEEENERRNVAIQYSKAINEFIYCLIRCTKLLVAVVDGPAIGLGVAMLSHFDMVYATKMATFSTMYKQLNHIPEAGSILTLPPIIGSSVAHDVLFCDRKLTANEAYKIGWICELIDRRKLKSHIFSIGQNYADYCVQAVKTTKQLIRKNLNQMLEVQLESEEKLLANQWCSEECQKKFKDYLN